MDAERRQAECPNCRRLEAEVVSLRREVARLSAQVAKLTAALQEKRRRNKRQAAPFRKQAEPAAPPNNPGRKTGTRQGPHAHRSVPPRIDATYDAPPPPTCPHCASSRVRETHIALQYQTAIPRTVNYRHFDVHIGCCELCGRAVANRHELHTNSARGAAASQLGPQAHALLAILNKDSGLSHGKSVKLLRTLFPELLLARATSIRSMLRTFEHCAPAYEQHRADVRGAAEVAPDETGWRVGGHIAWLHVFTSGRATCYVIDPTRSHQPAEQLLGLDWPGTLVHDGWSVYNYFAHAAHQHSVRHLQRRCQELLEPATRGAARLPRTVLGLIDRAFAFASRVAWTSTPRRRPGRGGCGAGLRIGATLFRPLHA